MIGKHPEHKFDQGKENRATCILGLIHYDISGPMHITSMNVSRYIITFIDDFSRYTWVLFLKKKSEVCEKITELKAFINNASGLKIKILIYGNRDFKNHSNIENSSGLKIKILRSDNGGEYVSNEFLHICSKIGIQFQHSIPYTPSRTE